MRKKDTDRKKKSANPLCEKNTSPSRKSAKEQLLSKSLPCGSYRRLLIFKRILNRANSQLKKKPLKKLERGHTPVCEKLQHM